MGKLSDVLLEVEELIEEQEKEKWVDLKRFIRELRHDRNNLQNIVNDVYVHLANNEVDRAMQALNTVSNIEEVETSVSEKEVSLLKEQTYIEAIKHYRSRTGAGLRTAKHKIDEKKKELGL